MSPHITSLTNEEILDKLRADGASDDELAAIRRGMEHAAERGRNEDDEVRTLRRRRLLLVPWPKGWEIRDRGGDGGVLDNARLGRRVILSVQREADGEVWLHASISRRDRARPTYDDLKMLHRTFLGDLVALQLFVPESEHVDLREVLHLFACLTKRITPDFTGGTGSV